MPLDLDGHAASSAHIPSVGSSNSAKESLFARVAQRDGTGYGADWLDRRHHFRRFASEFIGTSGFVFVLSAGAAVFHRYDAPPLGNVTVSFLLSLVAALWLVIAIYALGDLSAHFNPAVTFAFAMRGDMSWRRAVSYWIVQCLAAAAGSGLAALFFGAASGLASVHPQPGQAWQAVGFETVLTCMFVFAVLAEARGPKVNGPFTPLAVASCVICLGTVGGAYEGAAFNPARAFGPDLVTGNFNGLWTYVVGAVFGAFVAICLDRYLRGAASLDESAIAESEPFNRS